MPRITGAFRAARASSFDPAKLADDARKIVSKQDQQFHNTLSSNRLRNAQVVEGDLHEVVVAAHDDPGPGNARTHKPGVFSFLRFRVCTFLLLYGAPF